MPEDAYRQENHQTDITHPQGRCQFTNSEGANFLTLPRSSGGCRKGPLLSHDSTFLAVYIPELPPELPVGDASGNILPQPHRRVMSFIISLTCQLLESKILKPQASIPERRTAADKILRVRIFAKGLLTLSQCFTFFSHLVKEAHHS